MEIKANKAVMTFDGHSVQVGEPRLQETEGAELKGEHEVVYSQTYRFTLDCDPEKIEQLLTRPSNMVITTSGEEFSASIRGFEDKTAPRRLKSRKCRQRKKWNKRYPGFILSGVLDQ